MSADTEHDALADTLLDCCALTRVGADLWHPRDEVINAILDKFLPDHDKRVRAEQREADIAAVIAAAPPINAELSPITGAVEDAGMAAYIEGFHDAWAAIREASDD